jgi:hypothetical protein
MGFLDRWLGRHTHPGSRVLHAIGIPLTIAAATLAAYQLWQWRWDLWWRPAGLLAVGYLMQFIGHRMEGSPMGELLILRRLVSRPAASAGPGRNDGNG